MVGARVPGGLGGVAAREDRDADLLARSVRELDDSADRGVALGELLAEMEIDVDRLVELGAGVRLDEPDGFLDSDLPR